MDDPDNTSLSGREASGWSEAALQALALLQGTMSGSSTARQPSGTGAGQKVRPQGSPLYSDWAPLPAPLGRNLELSKLQFGLPGTRASGELQAPALSWMYAHDTSHQTNQVGAAYPALTQHRENILSFLPSLST